MHHVDGWWHSNRVSGYPSLTLAWAKFYNFCFRKKRSTEHFNKWIDSLALSLSLYLSLSLSRYLWLLLFRYFSLSFLLALPPSLSLPLFLFMYLFDSSYLSLLYLPLSLSLFLSLSYFQSQFLDASYWMRRGSGSLYTPSSLYLSFLRRDSIKLVTV